MTSWFAWRVAPAPAPPDTSDWDDDDDMCMMKDGMIMKTAAVSAVREPKKTSTSSSTTTTKPTSTSTTTTITPTFTTSTSTHISATEGNITTTPTPSAPSETTIETTHASSPHLHPHQTLAQENAQLRAALASIAQQIKTGDMSKIQVHRVDGEETEQQMTQDELQEFIATLTKNMDEPTEEKADLLTTTTDTTRSLFVRQQGDSVDEQEIAIVDLDGIEWWTLVNPEEEEMERKKVNEKEMSEEGYVVLGNDDMRSALAEFVRQTMDRYPESQRLTPDQLKQMLEGTFQNLKEPSTMNKVWNWGKMLYTSYGWGSTALALYQDQRVIRLVASGVFKMATWVLVLVV